MKHDHSNSQNHLASHPGDVEFHSYLEGRLEESAHEAVQAHLVECDECLELFKDMKEFFEPQRPGEEMISEDIASGWRGFWNRANGETRVVPLAQMPSDSRKGFQFNSATILALAAVLLITFALGLWALSQRRQKQLLSQRLESTEKRTAELQIEQEKLAERLKQSEQEKLQLQEQARLATAAGSPTPREAPQPELNVPIYDLYARDFNRRSANESELNLIKAPATANSLVLILNGDGVAAAPSYGIEIVSDKGRSIWRGKGLTKGQLGNLTVTVDRKLLAKGTYKLKLYGQDGQGPNALAEYVLRVE